MIKKYFILSAVAAMATVACTKEFSPETGKVNENLIEMTFSAESEPSSKVAYNRVDNVGSLTWEANDKISVISKEGTFEPFTASSVDGNTATFTGWQKQSEEYYAVYPAEAVNAVDGSAFVTKGTKTGLLVDIPAVQKATAGTFDPKAFVAVSGPAVDGKFSFVNLCTVIGFQLKDPANVKAVRFEGLNTNNKGEAQAVTVASRGVVTPGDESGVHTYYDSPSTQITLTMPDGGFKAKTDYYFTTRPSKFDKGITVYIEYNDGSVKKRTSTKQLFTDNSRGVVKHLQTIDEGAVELTPYETYELGFDLVIAGKTYNKAEIKKDAVLVNSASATISEDGVYFINPSVSDTKISAKIYNKLLVSGNDDIRRSDLTITGTIQFNKDAVIVFNGLTIKEGVAADLIKPYAGGAKVVAFNNCHITTPENKTQFFYSGTNIENFQMYDCDIKVTSNSKQLIKSNANGIFTNLEFVNNIFYAADANGYQDFNVLMYGKTISTLVFNNNTLAEVYHCKNGSVSDYQYFKSPESIETIQLNNNLFYLSKYASETYAKGSYSSIIKCKTSYPTSGKSEMNVMYWTTGTAMLKITDTNLLTSIGRSTAYGEKEASKLIDTATLDIMNGIIVPNNVYGAKR